MLISFGICTYNRANLLRLCLNSIIEQLDSSDIEFEIIVNNDGNDQETVDVLDNFRKTYHDLILLNGHGKGLSIGRQAIINKAKAKFIAFIDDDAILTPYWLKNVSELIAHLPDKKVFGGPAYPSFTNFKEQTIYKNCLEKLSVITDSDHGVSLGRYPVGANFLVKRSVVESFKFNKKLGRRGTALDSNEETQLFRYVGNDNIVFSNSIGVVHVIDSRRVNDEWLKNRYRAEGRSFINLLQTERKSFLKLLYLVKIFVAFSIEPFQVKKFRLEQFKGAFEALTSRNQ